MQAIALMLASMACFACMSTFVRLLSETMPAPVMVFLRNILSLLIILAWSVWMQRRRPRFPTTRMKTHFWRASVGALSMELWFYALTVLPLTLATALSFTTPIFSTLFAMFFLGEKVGFKRWCAISVGFIGVMVILHPSGSMDTRAFLVLFSSSMMALVGVLVKSLTRTESPETIVFYMALFMIPWSVPPALFHVDALVSVTSYQLWLSFWIALFSTVAHLMLARAFVRAELVVLMPLDFTRLIFVSLLAYPLFGETIDGYTVIGALIIVASTVYIAHRERKKSLMPDA